MSAADVTAPVFGVFFAVGVAVGTVTVIALSARRADKADRWRRHAAAPAAEAAYFDDDEPGEQPPWWQRRDGA